MVVFPAAMSSDLLGKYNCYRESVRLQRVYKIIGSKVLHIHKLGRQEECGKKGWKAVQPACIKFGAHTAPFPKCKSTLSRVDTHSPSSLPLPHPCPF